MDDNIVNTIKSREIKMRSSAYFRWRSVFIVLAAILVFLVIIFVATFIIFALQQNGGFFATNFGPAGWEIFLFSLPWSFLLLSIVLILILWLLLRRYPIIYHQPFLYTLLTLIIVIALACFFLSASSIHGGIFRYVSKNQIPVVTGVYEFETAPMSGVYRGQVVVLATSSFILENGLGQTSTVIVVPGAWPELGEVTAGDYVIMFGHGIATATIEAYGLEPIVDYQ
ncbi:MAG TPA: hypothetical protein VIJ29_03535 [Candidatus Paceibacterota bacterium]